MQQLYETNMNGFNGKLVIKMTDVYLNKLQSLK